MFCGPPTLGERFPEIVEGYGSTPPPCLDLLLEGSLANGIRRADFEGGTLADLLDEAGHGDDAARLRLALAGPTADALVAIGAAARQLLA